MEHFSRYPAMEPRDGVKLVYQSAFGPGHLIRDRDAALAFLRRELEGVLPGEGPLYEPIGGGYARLHLAAAKARSMGAEDIFFRFLAAAQAPAHIISAPGKRSARGNWHERSRIGIMGGTFDPIHNGHLVAASEVAWVYDLDEVIFVPTGRPVFKLDKHVTNAEDRYLMTVIATASNPKFTVSRVDIDRPGITYTIDTLRDLRALYPDADLFFITGADAVAEIMQWKDVEQMFDIAHFVAVTRPGYAASNPLPEGKVDMLEIPALAISSTDVRRRATHGEPVWYLVPDGVVQYIGKHGLYHAS